MIIKKITLLIFLATLSLFFKDSFEVSVFPKENLNFNKIHFSFTISHKYHYKIYLSVCFLEHLTHFSSA